MAEQKTKNQKTQLQPNPKITPQRQGTVYTKQCKRKADDTTNNGEQLKKQTDI